MQLIILSIPIFFVLILLELVYDIRKQAGKYRTADAITNISCGITEQLSGLFAKLFTFGIYAYLYNNYRLLEVNQKWYMFILLFLAVDFLYYWTHRLSHEVNLFWAGHVVHHQSEDYNLSVALRQGAFQKFFTFGLNLPLAFLGFPTEWFITISALNTLYQFWIHTEFIGKMGFFEKIFNTPSHHRVHHGRNPKYIDKNHAGSLIIWDKMFGTFQEEEETPVYGITTPLNSWNPVYAQVAHFGNIYTDFKRVNGIGNKLKVLFYKPGWLPKELGGMRAIPNPETQVQEKFNPKVEIPLQWYAIFSYLILLGVTSVFLFQYKDYTPVNQLFICGYLFFAVAAIGWMLEQRKGWQLTEILRVATFPLLGLLFTSIGIWPFLLAMMLHPLAFWSVELAVRKLLKTAKTAA